MPTSKALPTPKGQERTNGARSFDWLWTLTWPLGVGSALERWSLGSCELPPPTVRASRAETAVGKSVQMRATLPVLRRLTALSTAIAAASVPADGQQIPDLPAIRVESVYGLQSPSTSSTFPITRLDDGQASGDLDRVPAGTLTFAHPLPVRDVLFMLFRGTPFSVVFDPAVNGTFTGELTDLTLRQALEAVLVPAGLDFERRGRVVHVFPRRVETRLFEVSVVDAGRSWRRRTGTGEARQRRSDGDGRRGFLRGARVRRPGAPLAVGTDAPRSNSRHRAGHGLCRAAPAGRPLYRGGHAPGHAAGAIVGARPRRRADGPALHRLDGRGKERRGRHRTGRGHPCERSRRPGAGDRRIRRGPHHRGAADPGDEQPARDDAHRRGAWGRDRRERSAAVCPPPSR